jgi:hypothetical protein
LDVKKMSREISKSKLSITSDDKVTSKRSNVNPKKESGKKNSSSRRLHVTSPSSASEIREALGITKTDLEIAREAIESST